MAEKIPGATDEQQAKIDKALAQKFDARLKNNAVDIPQQDYNDIKKEPIQKVPDKYG